MVSPSDIIVEVRLKDFTRIGQVDIGLITGGKFIKRKDQVGAWQFTLPNEHPACAFLKTPGSGVVVWLGDRVYLSGPMVTWTKTETQDDPDGVTTFAGADDLVVLSHPTAWPDPATADPAAQTTTNDVRTGPVETVLKQYVAANIVNAPPFRRQALANGLRIATDQQRGGTVTGSPRFTKLGDLLSSLTAVEGTTGFDVVQDATTPTTLFDIYQVVDRSDLVRMDIDNDLLKEASSGISGPGTTYAIVAGQGTGTDRQIYPYTDAEALQAEADWGWHVETFIDQRNTSDVDELTQSGIKEITANGRTTLSLKVVPADGDTMQYGIDWDVGDRVAVIVDDQPLADVVSEAIMVVEKGDVKVGATIGNPVGYDWEAEVTARINDQGRRLSALERVL